ncbi:unnamed protein product, partial [Mesorhabditis belari]
INSTEQEQSQTAKRLATCQDTLKNRLSCPEKDQALEKVRTRTMTSLELDEWTYSAKNASWYKAIDQVMKFDDAVAYCASQKGHLVSIHSQEENHFVQRLG